MCISQTGVDEMIISDLKICSSLLSLKRLSLLSDRQIKCSILNKGAQNEPVNQNLVHN